MNGDFFFFSLGKYYDYKIKIGELWKHVLSKCHGINAEALAMSIRISKEREKKVASPGAPLDAV